MHEPSVWQTPPPMTWPDPKGSKVVLQIPWSVTSDEKLGRVAHCPGTKQQLVMFATQFASQNGPPSHASPCSLMPFPQIGGVHSSSTSASFTRKVLASFCLMVASGGGGKLTW